MISIHEYKSNGLKRYYNSTKRVYRQSHIEKFLIMWKDLHYLGELRTRTRLVPINEDFLVRKAIPTYNENVIKLQLKYPNIKEFHSYKLVDK